MWIWKQTAGELWKGNVTPGDPTVTGGGITESGLPFARGYSGFDTGKNNPAMQADVGIGPIPQGWWTITGPPIDTSTHGPFVLHLEPSPNTVLYGRSGFLMHGDSIPHPGSASHGCIILPRAVREQVWLSGDRDLLVLA